MPNFAMPFISSPNDNIYVEITGTKNSILETEWVTNELPIQFDDQLVIAFLCKTSSVPILVPVNKGIFIKFELQNATGKSISKTAEGNLWGADVENFPAKPGRKSHDKMTGFSATGPEELANPAYTKGPSFPSAKDLFAIDEPGIYQMTAEVHFMKQIMLKNDPAGWTWKHIKIGPFTAAVEKPSDYEVKQTLPGFPPATSRDGMAAFSASVEDVFVGIGPAAHQASAVTTNGSRIQYDKQLMMGCFCDDQGARFCMPGDKRNFVRFEMRNPSGHEVAKTAEGKIWGSKFDEFSAQGLSKSVGPYLPPPKQLFEMADNGVYEMTLEVRLLKGRLFKTNEYRWQFIEIPPFVVKVEKSPSLNSP